MRKRLNRRQLRMMILNEIKGINEAADATSAKGSHHLKEMFDYLIQAGMKYSPLTIGLVMFNYADEINGILQRPENKGGGPKAAGKKFIELAKNI